MYDVSLGYLHVDANSNGFEQSLDEKFGIPKMKKLGFRKSNEVAKLPCSDRGPRRLSRNRNHVQRFIYDGYVAHHRAYMEKVEHDVEPTCFEDVVGNVHWDNAMDEEMTWGVHSI